MKRTTEQEKLTFKVQNLLQQKGSTVSGAMSPVLFAQEMSRQYQMKLHGLCRVHFDNQEVHNNYENGKSKGWLTGCDTLVLMQDHGNCKEMVIMIDTGTAGIPAAVYFTNDPIDDITITPVYEKYKCERHLTKEEFIELFKYIVEHPEVINPVMKAA